MGGTTEGGGTTIKGRLEFFAETGTEGGYWALQDQRSIKLQRPAHGVWAGHVWDTEDPERHGTVLSDHPVQVLNDDAWLPLPDPVQADEDYALSSLFRGEFEGDHRADERLMSKYGFRMIYTEEAANETLGEGNWHREEDSPDTFVENSTNKRWSFGATPRTEPSRPYGVSEGELTRVMVEWDDGLSEQRLSDSLLVESWSYDGLHILKDGDHLTVYSKDGIEVLGRVRSSSRSMTCSPRMPSGCGSMPTKRVSTAKSGRGGSWATCRPNCTGTSDTSASIPDTGRSAGPRMA